VIRYIRYLLVATLSLAAFSQLSCKLNDYCLECGKSDGGSGDGSGSQMDAPIDSIDDSGTCVPTGPETCNGVDDDCNGLIDDGVLPGIGDLCANQMGECAGGVQQCTPTFHCAVTTTTICRDANDTTSCPTGEACAIDGKNTDHITCTKNPSPESCDSLDNNCNGVIDEGDPGDLLHSGGARCGNGNGTCVQGVYHCAGACVNMADGCTGTDSMMCQGGVGPTTETCDGLDNDCDGSIDNGIATGGACGAPNNNGACKQGIMACVGGTNVCAGHCSSTTGQACGGGLPVCPGAETCVAPVAPSFELCNNADDDCNGTIDDGFQVGGIYNQSTQNCGACGTICGAGLPNGGNAVWTCSAAGTCQIASCKAGYHDNINGAVDGCEFGVCFDSGPEVCDGADNDCDGKIDETPAIGTAPTICATQGECKNAVAACPCANMNDSAGCFNGGTCTTTCTNQGGWECSYPATVTVDTNGAIVPETKCDNLDNDCDGIIDNNQIQLEHADCAGYTPGNAGSCPALTVACDDGKQGICRGTGHFQCDDGTFPGSTMPGGNLNGPALCHVTAAGSAMGTESCNNLDDDCDGVTDEGSSTGSISGQTWIEIGGGHQMMEFEASRPDAAGQNVVTTSLCTNETIAASPGGATESGTTATYTTNVPHGLVTGQRVTVSGIGVAGYDGTFLVASTPSTTTFTVTLAASGLAASGGGLVATHCPISITAATETGSVATFTTSVAHGFTAGQAVIISGVTNNNYNGTWVILSGSGTTFTVQLAKSGLAASSGGTAATNGVATCSKQSVTPWTNVTYPQALAACQAVGATLCTDEEWHRSCSANATGGNLPTIYPVTTTGSGLLIEAEDYFSRSTGTDAGGTTRSWIEDETAGYFGISDLFAQPNTGGSISAANAPTQSPRLDYKVIFSTTSANYHVCVHMFANSANDNAVFVGINGSLPGAADPSTLVNNCGSTTPFTPCWQWITSAALNVTASGTAQFVSLYMQKDGTKVDALYVVNGACPGTLTNTNEAGTVHTAGEKWAMQPSATLNNYTTNVCNDQNYTGAGNGNVLATGTLSAGCYADDSGLKSGSTTQKAFDMSGNVREWTLAHQPAQNPIRGGAYNDTALGIDCPGNFLLADDKFLLPNVGFRCCR
jgi:hypothetical protein